MVLQCRPSGSSMLIIVVRVITTNTSHKNVSDTFILDDYHITQVHEFMHGAQLHRHADNNTHTSIGHRLNIALISLLSFCNGQVGM